jgi:hypothetical protein
MNRIKDKGKNSFCGVSPAGQGLPENMPDTEME